MIVMEDKILTKDLEIFFREKIGAEAMFKDRSDEKFSEPRRSRFVDEKCEVMGNINEMRVTPVVSW